LQVAIDELSNRYFAVPVFVHNLKDFFGSFSVNLTVSLRPQESGHLVDRNFAIAILVNGLEFLDELLDQAGIFTLPFLLLHGKTLILLVLLRVLKRIQSG